MRLGWLLSNALIVVTAASFVGCATEQPAPVVDLSLPPGPPPARVASAEPAPGNYRVVRGDTLYAIAFKHGLDYRDLAAWNGISAPYRILVGQELRLGAPAREVQQQTQRAAPPVPLVAASPAEEPKPGEATTAAVPDRVVTVAATPSTEKPAAPQPTPFENVGETASPPAAAPEPPAEIPSNTEAASMPAVPTKVEPAPTPKLAVEAPPKATVAVAKPAVPVEAARPDNVPELSSGGVTWRWPSDGKVIAAYVSGDPTRQGIDIGGKAGDAVRAAAEGEIVYSGNGLIGYGELIIVKHNASFLSAYGHNRSRLVKEGDKVRAGQAIAEMGSSASARDELHFEIRKNGKPVNPLEYLPAR